MRSKDNHEIQKKNTKILEDIKERKGSKSKSMNREKYTVKKQAGILKKGIEREIPETKKDVRISNRTMIQLKSSSRQDVKVDQDSRKKEMLFSPYNVGTSRNDLASSHHRKDFDLKTGPYIPKLDRSERERKELFERLELCDFKKCFGLDPQEEAWPLVDSEDNFSIDVS